MRWRILAIAGAICGFAAPVQAQEALGADCALCRSIGAGASLLPSANDENREATHLRNFGAVSNCLDRTILGSPRQLAPQGDRWQETIQSYLGQGLWHDSLGLKPSDVEVAGNYLRDWDKISALYRVLFGQLGEDSLEIGAEAQAKLTCQAVFVDLNSAFRAVQEASR